MSETGPEEQLSAKARSALQHIFRRQILRVLPPDAARMTPAELTETGQVPCTLSCAAYHLQVLVDAGLVESVESAPIEGRTRHSFRSLVEAESPTLALLLETEESDLRHLAQAAA